MHKHTKNIVTKGASLEDASQAMLMIHGRGATAEGILDLSKHLKVDGFALLAPQATMNTWYPHNFMAPVAQNEPGLSSALEVIGEIVSDIIQAGIAPENFYFLGFSQGACLASEFAARNAQKYGGVFVLSGGVIGEQVNMGHYQGDFKGTPILLGCSDVDAHIPLGRVKESAQIFKEMGAEVEERIYPNAHHTIFKDEIEFVNEVLSK